MRTLKLLEHHHQKLAELLKVKPDEIQAQASISFNKETISGSHVSTRPTVPEPKSVENSPRHVSHHIQPHPPTTRRELSSSIASNLASARGIPPHRSRRVSQSPAQLSPHHAEGRVLKPPRKSNLGEGEAQKSLQDEKIQSTTRDLTLTGIDRPQPLDLRENQSRHSASVIPSALNVPTTEDPFSRFYSTFGNLLSTLSAPLAFAGLPLGSETSPKAPGLSPDKPTSPSSSRVAADPDLARYFSRAALRAVRDEHGGFGGVESFYVVPTTGGTRSYADMLSHNRQASNLTEDDEHEFVDASETPQPASPGLPRHRDPKFGSTSRQPTSKGGKTWEELAVENETLKAVVLDLGDRLRAFELGAQRSSRALHASVRGLSSPSDSISGGGGVPPLPGIEGMKVLQEKLRESEDEIKALKKENKRLSRECQKHIGVIERYRERWEMLKVNARERVKGDSSNAKPPGESED